MAERALQDFKKYKKSSKCRYYKNIINFLRVTPCGFKDRNEISEFQDFIPLKHREGVKLEKVVEIVLAFYVGYSELIHDEDFKKLQKKIGMAKWYAKNKEKYKAQQREKYNTNAKYRRRKLRLAAEDYRKDPEYRKIRYGAQAAQYRQENKERLQKNIKKWNKKNKDKMKKYARKYYIKKKLGLEGKTRYSWV